MKRTLTILISLAALQGQAASVAAVKQKLAVIEAITQAAHTVGVSPELMLAVAWVESSYRTNVTHMDGTSPSYGALQIKLETAQYVDKVYKHKYLITSKRLSDKYVNALYGCKYMRLLIKQYKGDVHAAVDTYNKGHLVSRHSTYVQKVRLAGGIK